ncbi:MAG: hypothetical protein GWN37_13555 [Gammaproteobacteria bacterium]|nr:hypothetical protein [Gammaproteobacteria bacterium]
MLSLLWMLTLPPFGPASADETIRAKPGDTLQVEHQGKKAQVTVVESGPDVVITELRLDPNPVYSAEKVTITAVVQNVGTAPASALVPVVVSFWYMRDRENQNPFLPGPQRSFFDVSDPQFHPPLAPGGKAVVSITVSAEPLTTPTEWVVVAAVDHANILRELNEKNNETKKRLRIEPPPKVVAVRFEDGSLEPIRNAREGDVFVLRVEFDKEPVELSSIAISIKVGPPGKTVKRPGVSARKIRTRNAKYFVSPTLELGNEVKALPGNEVEAAVNYRGRNVKDWIQVAGKIARLTLTNEKGDPLTPKQIMMGDQFRVQLTFDGPPYDRAHEDNIVLGSNVGKRTLKFREFRDVGPTGTKFLSAPIFAGSICLLPKERKRHVPVKPGRALTAQYAGTRVQDRATVLFPRLPPSGIVRPKGYTNKITGAERSKFKGSCSCDTVTLVKIEHNQTVVYDLHGVSTPPQTGTPAIPVVRGPDTVYFYFSYPECMAYRPTYGSRYQPCPTRVTVKYPGAEGLRTIPWHLYEGQGMPGFTSPMANRMGFIGLLSEWFAGRGSVSWQVNGRTCGTVPFTVY